MVSLISILYNSQDFIKPFLESVSRLPKGLQIVLYDNHSKDQTIPATKETLRKLKLKALLIESSKNIGFCKAVNRCMQHVQLESVFLVNPDTIINKSSLLKLFSFYKQVRPAIVGGRFVDYEGRDRPQYSAVRSASFLSCLFELTSINNILKTNSFWAGDTKTQQKVAAVSGGCMLFSKKIWSLIRGFDENYFMYLEDLDFCLRAKKAGYPIFYVPEAFIHHFSGGSSKNTKNKHSEYAWYHSRDYFFKKHFSSEEYALFKAISSVENSYIRLKEKFT